MKHTTDDLLLALKIRELALAMKSSATRDGPGPNAPFSEWLHLAMREAAATADIIKTART